MFKLTARRWGWINFKFSIMVWAAAMFWLPPSPIESSLGYIIHAVWTALAFVGALISIIGMVMEARPGVSGVLGISVELTGLCFMAVGPLVYFITQVSLLVHAWPDTSRFALCFFAWAMVCAVIARLMIVIPQFRREANDPHKAS